MHAPVSTLIDPNTATIPTGEPALMMNIRSLGTALLLSSLALAGCVSTGPGHGGGYGGYGGYDNGDRYGGGGHGGYGQQAACYDCGTVTRIEQGAGSRATSHRRHHRRRDRRGRRARADSQPDRQQRSA